MATTIEIFGVSPKEAARRVLLMTPRERQVAECVALGIPFRTIAKLLGISRAWVHNVLTQVRGKFDTTTAGIARWWFAAMMVLDPDTVVEDWP